MLASLGVGFIIRSRSISENLNLPATNRSMCIVSASSVYRVIIVAAPTAGKVGLFRPENDRGSSVLARRGSDIRNKQCLAFVAL